MPVISDPPWSHEPRSWVPISTLEIQNAVVAVASRPNRDCGINLDLLSAAQAFVASVDGDEVFVTRDDGGRCWFAVGPRFVPEQGLGFSLDEALDDATAVDPPVEFDRFDPDVQNAWHEALVSADLARPTENGLLYDAFAEHHHYSDVATSVVDAWEREVKSQTESDSDDADEDEG